MNINATVLVQIINFGIVYALLRTFLFKPVVAEIDKENEEMTLLFGIVDQQKKSIEIKEKERQQQWYMCREYSKTQRPDYTSDIDFIHSDGSIVGDSVDSSLSEDIHPLVVQVSKEIEEKIKNVH